MTERITNKYRKKNFKAVIVDDNKFLRDGDFSLRVTFNGCQWQSIGLNEDEAAKIIETLQDYLKSNKSVTS